MELHGYVRKGPDLNLIFTALADGTRRQILTRLTRGEASVGELCVPFKMSQPAVSKHLKVLERAGLIERQIDRQKRLARLKAEPLSDAVQWLQEFRSFWTGSFDQLDGVLAGLKKPAKKRKRK